MLRRVNKTSTGICTRDCVLLNKFSGEKTGSVAMNATRETAKRIARARDTAGGIGRIGRPGLDELARNCL